MLEGVVEQVVDIATAEPGEPRQLMNNHDIDLPIGDRFAESVILCAALLSSRDNIGNLLDTCVKILLDDKLLDSVDLESVVLEVGRDTGV